MIIIVFAIFWDGDLVSKSKWVINDRPLELTVGNTLSLLSLSVNQTSSNSVFIFEFSHMLKFLRGEWIFFHFHFISTVITVDSPNFDLISCWSKGIYRVVLRSVLFICSLRRGSSRFLRSCAFCIWSTFITFLNETLIALIGITISIVWEVILSYGSPVSKSR